MSTKRLNYLSQRYLDRTLTADETEEWQQLVNDQRNEEQLLSLIENSWKTIPENLLEDMSDNRSKAILSEIIRHPQINPKSVKVWPLLAIAASIALAVITGGYFYFNKNQQTAETIASKNDIIPGKNDATLILANGKTLRLSNSKKGVIIGDQLTYDDATSVSPTVLMDKVSMLTATTPRGGTYEFTLPDGTKIWLNADSKITFPSKFTGKQRKVSLIGEAYFEVAHNKFIPFIVESEGQRVEVLGTHFNVNSYEDEGSTRTTLVEGSVRITNLRTNNSSLLKPDQQATINGNNLAIREFDASLAVAWKNGFFLYKNTSLQEAMRQIARWYDVEVVFQKPDLKDNLLSGSVSRFDDIREILKVIEDTGTADFKIIGKKIIVN